MEMLGALSQRLCVCKTKGTGVEFLPQLIDKIINKNKYLCNN